MLKKLSVEGLSLMKGHPGALGFTLTWHHQGLLPGLMDTELASQDVHERTRQSGLPEREAGTPRTARSIHTHAEQTDRKQNNSELPQTESSPQMLFCEETANEINGVEECT